MHTARDLQRKRTAKPRKTRTKKTATTTPKKRGRPPAPVQKIRMTTSLTPDARRLLRLLNANDPVGEGVHLSRLIEAEALRLSLK